MNMAGKIKITTHMLMRAPLAIKMHSELIISILEYMPTPKVAAKKLRALTNTDCTEAESAMVTDAFCLFPGFSLSYSG